MSEELPTIRADRGVAPNVSITFETLIFSDGTTIQLDPNDVVVFVGPNNAGKSAALRELEQQLDQRSRGTVIVSSTVRKSGTAEELRQYLKSHSRMQGDANNFQYQALRFNMPDSHLESYWQNNLDQFRPLFCARIGTETRITDANPQGAIAFLDQAPQHPIHVLYSDDRVEKRISRYFRRAFGEDLVVFHGGGGAWPLLVGQRPTLANGEDRISATYVHRLRNSTIPLQNQGDGMRSFASVILHMLTPDTPSILLLDEPEAFLHPPQARLLGEFIAQEKPKHSQLFIATHSSDVLQGLLNVSSENLRVLRIQRDGNVNRVKELDKARAKAIGSDPLMKFSSVLSGVFHQRVIVCESDADCLFYSSLLDLPEVHGEQLPDVLFVQAAGKHRMAALAEALRSLDVTVDVVADFDLLNDDSVLKRLVLALGGEWTSVVAESSPLKKAIEQHKPWLNALEVGNAILATLKRSPTSGEFPRPLRDEIESIFRKASPWDAIKDAGEAAIPAGQPTTHWRALQSICSQIGLWIVPKGELEGFCKSIGGHGPRWVQQVIESRSLNTDVELNDARNFVRKIWERKPPR